MKKIAIVYSGGKHWGGIETYLVNLFKYADKEKIDLTLVSLGEWELVKKCQMSNVKCQMFSGKRFRPRTIFKISRYLKDNNFSLVVSGGIVPNAYARAASFFSKIPSLVIVHSEASFEYPNPIIRFFYLLSDRLFRWPTKKYIAVSEYLKKQQIKKGISEKKITVIYNGIEASQTPNDKLQMTNKNQKLKNNPPAGRAGNQKFIKVGSIGGLQPIKGYKNLIQAAKLLDQDVLIEIAGEGKEESELKKLIIGLNLKDKVKLLGFVPAEKFYPSLDIYIQPSLSEGFSLTVAQAMSAGKPVIVTPVGALPELVEDGKTGVITKDTSPESLAEKIKMLAFDEDLCEKIGDSATIQAREKYNINRWAEKVTDAFLEAAK